MSTAPTNISFYAYPLSLPNPSFRFLCESWWTCWTSPGQKHMWRQRSDPVYAPGEPLSVILPSIRAGLDPVIKPARGWKSRVPTWRGCNGSVGRVEILLPLASSATAAYRPLSLLVFLPDQDPPDALPYIYLGAQFFLEYRAGVALDCASDPPAGTLSIP